MNSEFLDVSTDVDVDALLAEIRVAAQRSRRSKTQYSTYQFADESPKIVEVGALLQEIDRSGPFADAINQIPLRSGGWKGRLEFRVKRFLKYLVHWNTKAQADFNFSVMRSLGLVAQNLQSIQSNLSLIEKQMREAEQRASTMMEDQIGIITATTRELSIKADTLAATLEATSGQAQQTVQRLEDQISIVTATTRELSTKADTLAATLEATSGQEQETVQRLDDQVNRLNCELDEMSIRLLTTEQSIRSVSDSNLEMEDKITRLASEALAKAKVREELFDYFRFEHQFRGSIANIKARQSMYVELFRGRKNVLDLGCGRGEFVELLSENEINVTGIDSNEDMVEFCRDRGLPVVHADLFDYLSALPDGTLDGIAAFQVVEHFSFEQILSLINLCEQKLMPGGIMVAETVNTYCPLALAEFYIDPTHVRPVPIQMLGFLFGQGAFRVQSLIFSSAIGGNDSEILTVSTLEIVPEMSTYRDYAVVAIKL